MVPNTGGLRGKCRKSWNQWKFWAAETSLHLENAGYYESCRWSVITSSLETSIVFFFTFFIFLFSLEGGFRVLSTNSVSLSQNQPDYQAFLSRKSHPPTCSSPQSTPPSSAPPSSYYTSSAVDTPSSPFQYYNPPPTLQQSTPSHTLTSSSPPT